MEEGESRAQMRNCVIHRRHVTRCGLRPAIPFEHRVLPFLRLAISSSLPPSLLQRCILVIFGSCFSAFAFTFRWDTLPPLVSSPALHLHPSVVHH